MNGVEFGVRLRRLLLLASLVVSVGLNSGCAAFYGVPVRPPNGALFTNVKAPLTVHYDHTPTGREANKYSSRSTKFFQDFLITFLSFAWDDAAVSQIAREGGIEKVHYADYEVLNVLGIYAEFTVEVYGE